MTLDTRIYIQDKVNVRELFQECQRLLGVVDEGKRGPERQRSTDESATYGVAGSRIMQNECDQGLPAWLMIHYREGGPYRDAEAAAQHDGCNHPDDAEYYDPERPVCTQTEHDPVCWAEISLDTTYSYRGPMGMNCGALHAAIMGALAPWLATRGISWKWKDEYSGDVYPGLENLEGLLNSSDEAVHWFMTIALPAVEAVSS